MASPLERIATSQHASVVTYTDMGKIYQELLRSVKDMEKEPMLYLCCEKPLLAGTHH